MESLLQQAKAKYDLVVVDTPPLTAVSDAFPLLSKVDGVIIVGRVGRNRRDVAQRLHETLMGAGAPLLGVVANGLKSGRRGGMGTGTPTTTRPGSRAAGRRTVARRPVGRPRTGPALPRRLCRRARLEAGLLHAYPLGRGPPGQTAVPLARRWGPKLGVECQPCSISRTVSHASSAAQAPVRAPQVRSRAHTNSRSCGCRSRDPCGVEARSGLR